MTRDCIYNMDTSFCHIGLQIIGVRPDYIIICRSMYIHSALKWNLFVPLVLDYNVHLQTLHIIIPGQVQCALS